MSFIGAVNNSYFTSEKRIEDLPLPHYLYEAREIEL